MIETEALVIDDELVTISDAIRLGAERTPDADALIHLSNGTIDGPRARWTYRELYDEVLHTAAAFQGVGSQDGNDVVSILLPNRPETIISFFAASSVGAANPINLFLNVHHIIDICNAVGTTILVTEGPENAEAWPKVLALLAEVSSIRAVLVVGDEVPNLPKVQAFWPTASSNIGSLRPSDDGRGRQDIAAYFHTGGTTGSPKLARHTHGNEIANASALVQRTNLEQITAMGLGLPLFHVAALIVCTLAPLIAGRAIVILGPLGYRDRKVVASIWDVVRDLDMDALMTVPTVAASLLEAPMNDDAVKKLRVAFCGASPVPKALSDRWSERMNAPLVVGYGLTESTCLSTALSPDSLTGAGSVGNALPGHQVRVVSLEADLRDHAGQASICQPGENGLVLLKGPNIFPGYVDARLNDGVLLDDGWLNTEDIGYLDVNGFLYLTGRAKDLIKRSGHGLDPASIEETLVTHPQVRIAAAVGKPDAYAGELPVAYVEIFPNSSPLDATELQRWCRERIADPAAVPTEIFVIDKLPVTIVGKISKVALRRDAARRKVEAVVASVLGANMNATIRCDTGDGINTYVEVVVRGPALAEAVTSQLTQELDGLPLTHAVTYSAE